MCCCRSMDFILVFVFSLSFIFSVIHQTCGTQFSMHEQSMLNSNTLAIKTIATEDGNIYDCVDVYKQPSLDHPLLQNHTLQMRPTFVLDGFNESTHEDAYPYRGLENGGCPEGSVPIRRIREEDYRRFQSYLSKYPTAISPNDRSKAGWHYALAVTTKVGFAFEGARGMLNVYKPPVSKEQHSDSVVYVSRGIVGDHNIIYAGWSVFPAVYGDFQTRLHTQWTANDFKGTGCIDIHCRGFVQVNKGLPLGYPIKPPSVYGGKQFQVPITINQDQASGNWWLIASFNVVVGYWPKELFTGLASYADEAGWGGRVFSPIPYRSPQMGSGHLAEQGFGKAAFIKQMQYVKSGQGSFQDLKPSQFLKHVDRPDCYDVSLYLDGQNRCNMFFGGPGGNCGWPL